MSIMPAAESGELGGVASNASSSLQGESVTSILIAHPYGKSASRPTGFALLAEGPCAFLEVVRSHDPLHGVQRIVQLEGLVLRHHLGVAQQLLDRRKEQGRSFDELPRDFPRLVQGLTFW